MSLHTHAIWGIVKMLLHEHNCVIIPGFGGFVCNLEPAKIDQVSHIILPPGKRIVFNQNLKTNDGLLAGKMAEKLEVSYIEAVTQIDELVNALRTFLQDKKQLSIETFGNFRLNADANYVFLPDKYHNYSTASFGLLPIQAEPISSRYIKLKRNTKLFRERKNALETKDKSHKNVWPKVLISTLVILLAVNVWVFYRDHRFGDMKIGNSQMSFMGWFDSLFNKQDAAQQTIPIITDVTDMPPATENNAVEELPQLLPDIQSITTDETIVLDDTVTPDLEEETIPLSVDMAEFGRNISAARSNNWFIPSVPKEEMAKTVDNTTDINSNNNIEMVSVDENAFYIIGGVFCKQHNAQRYYVTMKNKGYQAELLKNKNLNCNRVSLAKFTNRSEAERFLSEIKQSENSEAWLLHP